jgi:hypothetical protein
VTEKISDSSIDTVKEGEEFIVDTAIADTGFALAGETFGASIVVGLGAAYVNDHVSAGAKSVVRVAEKEEKKAEHSIGKTFKKIGNTISNWFT